MALGCSRSRARSTLGRGDGNADGLVDFIGPPARVFPDPRLSSPRRPMTRHVLALTFDGILQPLGFSQVLRVAEGLSNEGFRYTLLSLEREADLARHADVAAVQRRLARAGIEWIWAPYDTRGGATSIARNIARATRAASAVVRTDRPDVVHARAFHGGLVARALHTMHGTKYVFDARSYWVDEQVEEGRRFTSERAYALAKHVERDLFERAAGIVTLTALQADDVREGRLGAWHGRPVEVIPTCADYAEFRPRTPGAPRPAALDGVPEGARVLGIVGALNRSYGAPETALLAREILALDPRVHLLVLTAQGDEYRSLLRAHRVDEARTHITRVSHDEMPRVLPFVDWGLLLLRSNFAKRASMPTKLAEFFACGVRPLQHGCNPEVSGWVARAGTGLVLEDLSPDGLASAATRIVSADEAQVSAIEGRDRTKDHFSLEAGVVRYARLLREVTERSDQRQS